MEVKTETQAAVPTSVKRTQRPGFLINTLSRKELTLLLNWAFRIIVVLLAIYLLGQGSKWVSAFVFGFGFAAVGIGVYLTFRVLNFPDLTIQGSYTLGAAVAVNLIFNNEGSLLGNPWFATMAATVAGGLAGLVTGVLHTRLKINGILASILVSVGLYSINLRVLAPTALINIGGKPNILESFYQPYRDIFSVQRLDSLNREWLRLAVFVLIALVLVAFFNWFLNTQLGLALRATGDNENMIRALGVDTNRAKVLVLTISNALFGLAGALLAQYLEYADGLFGLDMIVYGLAAVILGESFVAPRSVFTALVGTVVGAIIYRLLFTAVFGLEISWGIALRFGLTLGVVAALAYLVFLTINSQTPAYITLICLLLGAAIAAALSGFLDALIRNVFNLQIDGLTIFKAEQTDIKLVLAALVLLAVGVPTIRNRIGGKAVQAALTTDKK